MTNIALPRGVRVAAYVIGILCSGLGSATDAYLLDRHVVSAVTASFILVLIGVLGTLAHTMALSHLSIPDVAGDVTTAVPVAVAIQPSPENGQDVSEGPSEVHATDSSTETPEAVSEAPATPVVPAPNEGPATLVDESVADPGTAAPASSPSNETELLP